MDEYKPKNELAVKRATDAVRALCEEDQQAFVFSIMAGAMRGALDEDALAEFVTHLLGAYGAVVLVLAERGPHLRGSSRTDIPEPRATHVAKVMDAAMEAMHSAVDRAVAEIGGTRGD